MAPTPLNATPGSSTANAYVTLAVANQYHEDRPVTGSAWSSATDNQKIAAILWATKLLDRMFVWNGFVFDDIQSLLWPRQGLYMLNEITPLDQHSIPLEIQWATAEFARQLLESDRTADSDIETQGLKLVKAGPIRVDFKDDVYRKPVPDIVVDLIPIEWGHLREESGIRERELQRY